MFIGVEVTSGLASVHPQAHMVFRTASIPNEQVRRSAVVRGQSRRMANDASFL